MFPTDRVDESRMTSEQAEDEEAAISEKLRLILSSLTTRKSVPNNDASGNLLRPGSSYERYRLESDLDEKSKVFFEAAAKTAGVALETLVLAVYQTERRVQGLTAQGSRRQTAEEESESEGEGVTDNLDIVDEPMAEF